MYTRNECAHFSNECSITNIINIRQYDTRYIHVAIYCTCNDLCKWHVNCKGSLVVNVKLSCTILIKGEGLNLSLLQNVRYCTCRYVHVVTDIFPPYTCICGSHLLNILGTTR